MHPRTPPLNAVSVLITDDNADIVDSLAILLRAEGFTVHPTYSAREALELLDDTPGVDAVVSDVRMPEVDGFDFLRAVGHRFPAIRVILVTGEPITDDDVVPPGATILRKPIEIDDLVQLLREGGG